MCASCGCGCKHGIAAKGCNCKCKECREARMSVEKSHLIRKAYRGFEAIADAVYDDVHADDLLVDDYGNVYVIFDEDVEKADHSNSNVVFGSGAVGAAGAGGFAAYGHHQGRSSKKNLAEVESHLRGAKTADSWQKNGGNVYREFAEEAKHKAAKQLRHANTARSHVKYWAGAGAIGGAGGLGIRAMENRKVEKADDRHRHAKIGAGIGVAGAAGLTASQAKELRMGHAVGRAIGISNNSMNRAYAKGLGRRFGLAAGTGALGGAGVDYLRNKDKVEKGIPRAIQARKTGGAYGTARRKANRAGQDAARAFAIDAKRPNFLTRMHGETRKIRGGQARDEARSMMDDRN